MPEPSLNANILAQLDSDLQATDDLLAGSYPGDQGRWQPVHTVYVPADRFAAVLPAQWGQQASDLVAANGGIAELCAALGVAPGIREEVADRVSAKLSEEPIEDLRLDFEDGYGDRGDDVEDQEAVAVAGKIADAIEGGRCPRAIGIRFKCFEEATRARGIRTLDLFIGALLTRLGHVPSQLVLTFPKVSTVSQVEAMVAVCEALETAHQLLPGELGFEIQVETPQLILGADGTNPLAQALHAGQGRVTSLHYGTYDYSASLHISAANQAADHPAADHAKLVMQLAAAGTGIHTSDGSTNVIPTGSSEQVHAAWALHAGLVDRALKRGIYQGWDMHPGHLPTRFIATFAFYRQDFASAAQRLSNYIERNDSAVMDEPATARALARYVARGYACGAIAESEVTESCGLSPADLAVLARDRSDTESLRQSG
ncbi:hypothetical protein BH23ACT6_BH23ACT6_13260 [soil metagenome]